MLILYSEIQVLNNDIIEIIKINCNRIYLEHKKIIEEPKFINDKKYITK
jgi:hypothetical protein